LTLADLIFLDTAHEGDWERGVYRVLCNADWRGILVADDIFVNDAMREFWDEIETRKADITKYGHGAHGSGTGIVLFDDSVELEML
jgi:hypothetical protein